MTPESVLRWAEWAGDSPLYQALCRVIAEDPDLMRVLGRIVNKPQVNILFGAVQYIMARGAEAPLAGYYPNFTDDPAPLSEVAGPFRDFVFEHESDIVRLGHIRYTQTNECRRCIALLPMIWMSGLERFHLVDVGTSAGLNLAFDRYRYRWGDLEWGPGDSPVELVGESRGVMPAVTEAVVLRRIGIDLNPIDPSDPDQRLWLESMVWPEHHERRLRLRSALELASQAPIELLKGDALTLLPEVLDDLSPEDPVVVVNSFVLNQFDPEGRARFREVISGQRRQRPIVGVSMEAAEQGETPVAVLEVDDGRGPIRVGEGHHHGEWVDFYVRP